MYSANQLQTGKRPNHKVAIISKYLSIIHFQDVFEKYQYSTQPKLGSLGLPPRHPPLERPIFSLLMVSPAMNHEKDWRMPLTQYRKAEKYPKEVATYEQSVLALSRKMRNKSTPHCQPYFLHRLSWCGGRPGKARSKNAKGLSWKNEHG